MAVLAVTVGVSERQSPKSEEGPKVGAVLIGCNLRYCH